MLSSDKVLELNKLAKKQKFPKVLDSYQIKQLKILKPYTWEKAKVIPCHFINKTLVPRYFRVLMKPDRDQADTSLLPPAELAASVALCAFAIDMAEQDYVDLFGEFNEGN